MLSRFCPRQLSVRFYRIRTHPCLRRPVLECPGEGLFPHHMRTQFYAVDGYHDSATEQLFFSINPLLGVRRDDNMVLVVVTVNKLELLKKK